ncbi:MAG: YiiX/YebB-like N1pC/P60 family cysteine hydrolase [Alphaproteobacteria bacterium]
MDSQPKLSKMGRWLAEYLTQPVDVPSLSPSTPRKLLESNLQQGDVLLLEGKLRISTAIKYLTQSSWSHALLYVGPEYLQRAQAAGKLPNIDVKKDQLCMVEADLKHGVRLVGLDHYLYHHSRICRPIGLSDFDRQQLCDFALERLGHHYDLRNIIDLMRYLLPTPPIPARYRRKLLSIGSGDPTKAICSTLIAQSFQAIGYPILPSITYHANQSHRAHDAVGDPADPTTHPSTYHPTYHHRHHSLYTPRDFDVSPYFEIIKPSLTAHFDFHQIQWD